MVQSDLLTAGSLVAVWPPVHAFMIPLYIHALFAVSSLPEHLLVLNPAGLKYQYRLNSLAALPSALAQSQQNTGKPLEWEYMSLATSAQMLHVSPRLARMPHAVQSCLVAAVAPPALGQSKKSKILVQSRWGGRRQKARQQWHWQQGKC